MNAPDPFALGGRQDADAELYRLIAEYRGIEEAATAAGDDEDEVERLSDLLSPISAKVAAIRPTTLAGVLAVFDFAGGYYDLEYWPEEAIEGLRAILAGIPQPDGSILITQPDGSQGFYRRAPTPNPAPEGGPVGDGGACRATVILLLSSARHRRSASDLWARRLVAAR